MEDWPSQKDNPAVRARHDAFRDIANEFPRGGRKTREIQRPDVMRKFVNTLRALTERARKQTEDQVKKSKYIKGKRIG